MSKSSEKSRQAYMYADALHYGRRDLEAAERAYGAIIQDFPGTAEARRAAQELITIKHDRAAATATAAREAQDPPEPSRQTSSLTGFGWALLVVAIVALWAISQMDTSVSTGVLGQRVHNVGLMNQQRNYMIVAGVLALIGGILLVGGLIANSQVPAASQALREPERQPVGFDSDLLTKKCPDCAETIKLEALVCRYCGFRFDPQTVRDAKEKARLQHQQ